MWERPTQVLWKVRTAMTAGGVGGNSFMEKLALEPSFEDVLGLRQLEMLTCREVILALGVTVL